MNTPKLDLQPAINELERQIQDLLHNAGVKIGSQGMVEDLALYDGLVEAKIMLMEAQRGTLLAYCNHRMPPIKDKVIEVTGSLRTGRCTRVAAPALLPVGTPVVRRNTYYSGVVTHVDGKHRKVQWDDGSLPSWIAADQLCETAEGRKRATAGWALFMGTI